MAETGIDNEIADQFNAISDQSPAKISLTKADIALLVNSLGELHKSYANFLDLPFIMGFDPDGEEKVKEMESSAKRSFDLFAEFSNGLMARFVDEASK